MPIPAPKAPKTNRGVLSLEFTLGNQCTRLTEPGRGRSRKAATEAATLEDPTQPWVSASPMAV